MPTFEYQAKGADGQVVSGVVFGLSLDHALKDLTTKGMQIEKIGVASNPNDPLSNAAYTVRSGPAPVESVSGQIAGRTSEGAHPEPVRIYGPSTEQRSYAATSVWGPLVGKVPLKSLGFFFRQSATMLNAGVPIVQSINTLATQAQSPKFAEILREMVGHVEVGRSLSDCMQRYPEVFTPVMLSLVRAGELGGFLDEALAYVADYIDREIALRNLYRRLTFYPKLQVAVSILIVLLTNVIIHSMGKSGGLSSPLTEPIVWVFLTPIIIALFFFFRVGLANPRVKYNWDYFITKLPYIGTTYRQLTMAKFGRAFGALYRGGVALPKSLVLSADSCGNEYLRALMYPAFRSIEDGAGITETLKSTNAFSPIVLDMIATGETTGNLDQMLNKMAEFYEDEAATRSTQTAQIVGVVLGLLVAIYIGYVVITFWQGYASTVSG